MRRVVKNPLMLLSLLIVVFMSTIPLSACGNAEEKAQSVADLLEKQVYDTEVSVFGTVSLLGELFCTCFELTSNGATVQVWYDSMTENDGTIQPAVDVTNIINGDKVIVTGVLKGKGGDHYSEDDFWAAEIIKQQ
jgi:hypothetical protein